MPIILINQFSPHTGHEHAPAAGAEPRPNDPAEVQENDEPHNLPPQNRQQQGDIAEAVGPENIFPSNQPPQCAVLPMARGNNEIIQGAIPFAEGDRLPFPDHADENFLNQHFQPPANDQWNLRTANRRP